MSALDPTVLRGLPHSHVARNEAKRRLCEDGHQAGNIRGPETPSGATHSENGRKTGANFWFIA